MMSLMERNRFEFVGNKFECWECHNKDDVVKCTCWFADEGNREFVWYECGDCLRKWQMSAVLAWLEGDKSKPLFVLNDIDKKQPPLWWGWYALLNRDGADSECWPI
jgi:hypothetical protein